MVIFNYEMKAHFPLDKGMTHVYIDYPSFLSDSSSFGNSDSLRIKELYNMTTRK